MLSKQIKALRKAEISEFRCFAKFRTHFFSVFHIFHIALKSNIQNFTKQIKLTKQNIFWSKTPVFGSKTPVPNILYIHIYGISKNGQFLIPETDMKISRINGILIFEKKLFQLVF